ncbi:MAG: hypothetical protein PHE10_03470 [Kiritimatiellae bacterium]|nr:hypothetical protein [Kiritimatiellia bacterium]
MIPDLQASVLCDDVRQERNGKFMLIGIFDGLMQPVNQPVCPKICLLNRWCMGEGEFTQKSRIVAPDGVTVVGEGQPVPIRLSGEQQIATTVEVFINLAFRQAGTHWVEILLNQQLRMRYPLHVRKIQPPPPPAGHAPEAPGV